MTASVPLAVISVIVNSIPFTLSVFPIVKFEFDIILLYSPVTTPLNSSTFVSA